MKATVRTINGSEFCGDVSLKDGFAIITNAEHRELNLEKKNKNKSKDLWFNMFTPEPAEGFVWRIVKKKASIILPESQIAWIEQSKHEVRKVASPF